MAKRSGDTAFAAIATSPSKSTVTASLCPRIPKRLTYNGHINPRASVLEMPAIRGHAILPTSMAPRLTILDCGGKAEWRHRFRCYCNQPDKSTVTASLCRRTPKRLAFTGRINPRASVLECGGPPPLFVKWNKIIRTWFNALQTLRENSYCNQPLQKRPVPDEWPKKMPGIRGLAFRQPAWRQR